MPYGPISTVAEAVSAPRAEVRRMVVDAGGLPVPGNPLKLWAYEEATAPRPAPELVEHGAAVRAEFAPA